MKTTRRANNSSQLKFWLFITGICLLIGCAFIWRKNAYSRITEEKLRLEGIERELLSESVSLNQELQTLRRYSVIEKEATTRLGMVLPQDPPDTLRIRKSKSDPPLPFLAQFPFSIGD